MKGVLALVSISCRPGFGNSQASPANTFIKLTKSAESDLGSGLQALSFIRGEGLRPQGFRAPDLVTSY